MIVFSASEVFVCSAFVSVSEYGGVELVYLAAVGEHVYAASALPSFVNGPASVCEVVSSCGIRLVRACALPVLLVCAAAAQIPHGAFVE